MQQLRNILVMKFGGTSVGSPDAMQQVREIILCAHRKWPQMVVVTSALSGITDLILQSALQAANHRILAAETAAGEITRRHFEIVENLVSDPERRIEIKQQILDLADEFLERCREIDRHGKTSPRSLDATVGIGERLAVRVLAGAVASIDILAAGIEATCLIVTDDNFMSAEPDMKATAFKTRAVLDPLLEKGIIPVVTGFIAATQDQIPTTLGRGGSDYSAAILAAALNAVETWIWTDVDGVMTADPRLVPEARTIPELSYDEMVELANHGAKVLHPKTIFPVLSSGGTLRVRNTFNPIHPGTLLVNNHKSCQNNRLKAVTVQKGKRHIDTVQDSSRNSPVEIRLPETSKTKTRIPIRIGASSKATRRAKYRNGYHNNTAKSYPGPLCEELTGNSMADNTDMVTIICPGWRSSPGVAGQVFSALEQARVKVLASSGYISDISMNLFIGSQDTQNAMRILHGLIQ